MAGVVDLHSLHIYTGSDDYWTNVLQVHQAERAIACSAALIRRAAYVQKLDRWPRIAYDEWNVWFRTSDGSLEERYNMADALAVGTYLNIFVRNSSWVQMANLAQLVNAIAPIVTTSDAAVVQPIYYPVMLHAGNALSLAVDTHVHGPTVDAPSPRPDSRWPHRFDGLGPFTLVDAAATVDEAHKNISLTIVNRGEGDDDFEIRLHDFGFEGDADLQTLTAATGPSHSLVLGVETVVLEEGTEGPIGQSLRVRLPAKSFTAVKARLSS
jgi:alpha-N-arabinofuranosidase